MASSFSGKWTVDRKIESNAVFETSAVSASDGTTAVMRRLVPGLAKRDDIAQLFLDEIKVAATFDHPNLAAILESGTDGSGPYAVVERPPGNDLRRIIQVAARRAKPVPIPVAVHLVASIARALQHIHERTDAEGWPLGHLHGAVSPVVVHVGNDGVARLDEFGHTRIAAAARVSDPATLAERLPYVTPEQLCAAPLDLRSDLFSSGVILYEITTNRRPFVGGTAHDLMARIVECYPEPPTSYLPRYPAGLERVVLRSLARIPEERYQTCAGFAKALADFLERADLFAAADEVAAYLQELAIPPNAAASAAAVRVSSVVRPRVDFAPPPGEPSNEKTGGRLLVSAPPPPPPSRLGGKVAPLPEIESGGDSTLATVPHAAPDIGETAPGTGSESMRLAQDRMAAIRAEAEAAAREAEAEAAAVRRQAEQRQADAVRETEEQLRGAIAAAATARQEIQRLTTRIQEMESALDRQTGLLQVEEEARRAAESELVRARSKLREAEESARALDAEAKERHETERAAAEALAALRREVEDAGAREAALRREVEELVGREAEARQELKKTAMRLATARREAEEGAERKEEARRDASAASSRESEARSLAAAAAAREAAARADAEAGRREAESARADARSANERLEEVEAAMVALRAELETAKHDADVLRREADDFRKQAHAATSELDVRQLATQRLARELAEREVALAEKEAAARREVAASLQREMIAKRAAEAAQNREASAIADADAAEARAESAERAAEASKREAAEARRVADDLQKESESRNAARAAELAEHEQEREAAIAREADLLKREASARMEAERLAAELETRSAQVKVLDAELAVVAKDANVLRTDRDTARAALSASRAALDELREEIARVSDEAAAAKSIADRARRDQAALRAERDAASKRADAAERERDLSRDEAEQLLGKLAAEQKDRAAAERDAESARRLAAVASEETGTIRRMLEAANAEVDELRRELERAREELREYARGAPVPAQDVRNEPTDPAAPPEGDEIVPGEEAPYADESTDPAAAAEAARGVPVNEAPPVSPDTVKITFPEVALYLSSLAELPRSNITSDPAVFVGREAELRALSAFMQGDRPILTLKGAPGSGRSRLALRFAASRLVELASAGGAFHVDLSRARDAEGVCTAVAGALTIGLVASQPLAEVMKHLGLGIGGRGRMLLVLDDVDGVATVLADLLTRWLPLAPQARFLLVGREAVGAPGELSLEVGPLRMPGDGQEDPDESDGRSLRTFDAIQLYAARMRERRREAALAETGLDVIAGIVKTLGGFPLAIELAACREDPPTRLLRGLSQWAKDHPPVDAETEVEMTLAWAWSLLSPLERRVLTVCSPFGRPFTVDAVLELSGSPEKEGAAVYETIRQLRLKGLLRGAEVPGLPDETRIELHPVVRHWLLEHHAPDDELQERVDLRAVRIGRELAREAGGTSGAQEALRKLSLEAPALEDALSHALDSGGGQGLALHALLGLAPWLEANPPFTRFLTLADEALASGGGAKAAGGVDARLQAEVLLFRGRARRMHGQMKGSIADLELADGLAAAGTDRRFEVDTATEVALTRFAQGDRAGAQKRLAEALAHARRMKDERREAIILGALGEVARASGDRAAARSSYEEAVELHRSIGNRRLEGEMLGRLGSLLREQGELKAARPFLERALAMHKEVRDRTFEARTVGELAAAHLEQERTKAGRDLFLRAIQLYAETGDRHAEAVQRAGLGILEMIDGRLDESRAAFVRAIWILGDVGDRRLEAIHLAFLAALESLRGSAIHVAMQSVELARQRLLGVTDPDAATAIELLGGVVDLAKSRMAPDAETAKPHLDAAKKKLAQADAISDASEPVRLARLVLHRAFLPGDADAARSTG